MELSIQKANFWKRISAYLFDFILAVMLTVGIATVLSAILGYSKQNDTLKAYYDEYTTKYEAEFGVDFDVLDNEEEYNKLSEEEKANYAAATTAFNEAVNQDERVTKLYQKLFFLSLVIVSISVLLALLTVQFIAPFFFKNGQTLGKKIFGIAVMRTNSVRISTFVLFARAIFGLYVVETMFPIALVMMIYFGLLGGVGTVTIFLLLLLQLGLLIATKNRCAIHDVLADTVVVDMGSQRIFDSEEALLAFKQEQHAQEVAQTDYFGKTIIK